MKLKGPNLGLKDFRPIKPLGCGDTGRCAFFLVPFPMMYVIIEPIFFCSFIFVTSFDVFLLMDASTVKWTKIYTKIIMFWVKGLRVVAKC